MNILFITSWFPSKLSPYNGNFIENHALALVSVGHKVVVVHEGFSNRIPGYQVEREERDGLLIYHVFLPRWLKRSLLLRERMALGIIKQLDRQKLKFDLVHGHILNPVGPIAAYFAKALNLPLFITEQWSGFLPEKAGHLTHGFLREVRDVLERSIRILPVSETLKNAMQGYGLKGSYEVVENTVDTGLHRYEAAQEVDNVFVFLHISNFKVGIKNVEGIISAFAALQELQDLPPSKLLIAGDGDLLRLQNHLQSIAPDSMAIEFRGSQNHDQVANLMAEAGCFVLFSNFETFGCVVSESLCSGLPVISSSVGAITGMIDKNNGMLVEAGNEPMLTAAMESMLQKSSSFDRKQIEVLAHQRFGFKAIGLQLQKIYESGIAEFGSKPRPAK